MPGAGAPPWSDLAWREEGADYLTKKTARAIVAAIVVNAFTTFSFTQANFKDPESLITADASIGSAQKAPGRST
jgi:hypothetical protein